MPPWRATHSLTFQSIAEAIGIHLCRGREPHSGQRCFERHAGKDGGTVTMGAPYPYVHWSDRRMTRAGIKSFLMLAARIKRYDDVDDVWDWVRLYSRIRFTQEALSILGFRLAKDEWKHEKAQLRAMIAKSTEPAHMAPEDRELRNRAMAWSRP